MTRAVMEGVSFSLRDSLEIMADLGTAPAEIRATGGGARSQFWRQMLADVFGRPILRTLVDEGPAYGAALLAGVAAGVFENVEDACSRVVLRPGACEPSAAQVRLYDDYYAAYHELYPATVNAMHALSALAHRTIPADGSARA
jgi:xylulokinase